MKIAVRAAIIVCIRWNMVRDDALPESLYTINDIKSDFIILFGVEPFELDYDLIHKYTCMCLICKKYFRIATGGTSIFNHILSY